VRPVWSSKMMKMKLIFPAIFLILATKLIPGSEKYAE
jgi:hypothetical protein